MNTRREDCFYFSEVTDYGGHIPFCGVTAKLEDCPCQECKNYIPKNGAYQVIRKYQNGEIVAVRHGYWKLVIHRGDDLVERWYRKCSCCGTKFRSSFMAECCADIEGHAYLFPNCPACRAVMDGKESEDAEDVH